MSIGNFGTLIASFGSKVKGVWIKKQDGELIDQDFVRDAFNRDFSDEISGEDYYFFELYFLEMETEQKRMPFGMREVRTVTARVDCRKWPLFRDVTIGSKLLILLEGFNVQYYSVVWLRDTCPQTNTIRVLLEEAD